MTESFRSREEGDQFLFSTDDETLSDSSKRLCLENAIRCYNKAEQLSTNDEERASTQKNAGIAYYKMAQLGGPVSEMTDFYCLALMSLADGHLHGRRTKSRAWLSSNDRQMNKVIEDFTYHLRNNCGYPEQLTTVNQITDMIDSLPDFQRIAMLMHRTEFLQNYINTLIRQRKEYRKAEILLGEVQRPLKELEELFEKVNYGRNYGWLWSRWMSREAKEIVGEKADLKETIQQFQETCQYHTDILKIYADIRDGKYTYQSSLRKNGDTLVWEEAIQWFHGAIEQTTDAETKAKCWSRIGVIYDGVLQSEEKAKSAFEEAIRIANEAVDAKSYQVTDWYRKSKEALARYDAKERRTAEERKRELDQGKQREPFMRELASELKELNEKDLTTFIGYIYRMHPPKNPKHRLQTSGKSLKDQGSIS